MTRHPLPQGPRGTRVTLPGHATGWSLARLAAACHPVRVMRPHLPAREPAHMRRMLVLSATGLALGLALAACGESEEDKAKAEVCDARDDIRTQVRQLQNLTLGTATVDKVRASLEAIGKDLEKIADAQGQLSDSDKERVKKANQAFRSELNTLGEDIGESV